MNFEGVLAGLPDAVIAIDVTTRVIFWNSAAEVVTGRSSRRAQGRLLKEVFPGDSSVTRRLMETLTTGREPLGDRRIVRDGGEPEMPVSVVTAPLFARDGSVEAAVAVVRDLTRLRQLEAEVRRGETLAAAGRMAVGFAHEIRNPLGAIRGAVQLLSRELAGEPRLREYTDVVLTEVDRVNRIIELLLDLGRPVKSRAVPLNLHQLLERVLLVNEESAAAHRVSARAPLRPQPAAHPRRRGPAGPGLSQPGPQRPRGHAERGAPHRHHPGQPQRPLRQDGPGQRPAQHGGAAGGRRGHGHPRHRCAPRSSTPSSPPSRAGWASAWPSATASSRSITGPSRWRAPGAGARW